MYLFLYFIAAAYEWSGWDHKAHNQEELMLDLSKMKNLTTLQVRDMPCISNINLTSWAEHLKSLRNLQCLSLTRISDDGALRFVFMCFYVIFYMGLLTYFNLYLIIGVDT
jgi:hypothetical protein